MIVYGYVVRHIIRRSRAVVCCQCGRTRVRLMHCMQRASNKRYAGMYLDLVPDSLIGQAQVEEYSARRTFDAV